MKQLKCELCVALLFKKNLCVVNKEPERRLKTATSLYTFRGTLTHILDFCGFASL